MGAISTLLLLGISFGVKAFASNRVETLRQFPHFCNPHNDIRHMKELFSNYELTGTYLADPNAISQPFLIVKMLHLLYKQGGDQALLFLFMGLELVSLLLQISIYRLVHYEWKKNSQQPQSKSFWSNYTLLWIIFNPLTSVSPGLRNLQLFQQVAFFSVMYLFLNSQKASCMLRNVVIGMSIYLSPEMFFFTMPLTVVQNQLYYGSNSGLFGSFIVQISTFSAGIFASLEFKNELTNILNIIFVNDPAETLGNFWYLMHEMFLNRLLFFRIFYLFFDLIVCSYVILLFSQTSVALDKLDTSKVVAKKELQSDYKKLSRRRRTMLLAFSVQIFTRMFLARYPTLFDWYIWTLICLFNANFIVKHVEGLYILTTAVCYSFFSTINLWTTWLLRYSGNANFFYFQIIALMGFVVLIFNQLYMAVDAKAKKYYNLSINKTKKKDKAAKQE